MVSGQSLLGSRPLLPLELNSPLSPGHLGRGWGGAPGCLRGQRGESLRRAELAGHCFSGHPWVAGLLFSSFVKAPELFSTHETLHRIWHLIEKERNWPCWSGSALLWNADKHDLKIPWLHHGTLQRFLPLSMKNDKNPDCFFPTNRNYLSLLLILEVGEKKAKGMDVAHKVLRSWQLWDLPLKSGNRGLGATLCGRGQQSKPRT